MIDSSALAYALTKKAEWRREKAERHPEDVRNLRAAETLESLADQVKDLDPELAQRLDALVDDESGKGEEVAEFFEEVITAIGFRHEVTTIDELVQDVLKGA